MFIISSKMSDIAENIHLNILVEPPYDIWLSPTVSGVPSYFSYGE